ncbi:MAG: TRAP transporter small permease [Rhodobacteraceae bacterium]|jgi:TRAP-type C4-dicarboxylate transport system permease small subunit|nr:TRAP transporter small permease [Paracoccaceae bacterium]
MSPAALIRGRRRLAGLCMGVAGALGAAILLLLTVNVAARAAGMNLVWVSETSRVLFVWGVAVGMIAVSLTGQHFRVDLFGHDPVGEAEPAGRWEIILQLGAAAVMAYIALSAAPTIARAATQQMSAIPLTYGNLRAALVVALTGMGLAHLWRAAELALGPSGRGG